MLPVDLAEVGNKEGLFSIRFVDGCQVRSLHNSFSKMYFRVSMMKRGKVREETTGGVKVGIV